MADRLLRALGWPRVAGMVALLLLVAACGSSASTPTAQTSKLPSPSSVGKVTGAGVTKTIGAAGGTLSSGDNGITVAIPAGALASDTSIGIQPIENTAAGGLGAAYRLTPAGQTFTQPVQLSFPYSDDDVNGTSPEELGIAFQDSKGLWEWQKAVALDTSAKRLSVMTTHFTDWSKVPGLQLRPGKATVKVNGRVTLTATTCVADSSSGDTVYLDYACGDVSDVLAPVVKVNPATWSVNGAAGGNTTNGTVQGGKQTGVYTAPAKKPSAGTSVVQVSVQAKTRDGKKTLLVANITIVGGYHVVGSFKEANSELVCSGALAATVSDSIEFTLMPTPDGSYTVTDLTNTKTTYGALKVPYVSIRPSVRTQPDVFKATKGTVVKTGIADLVTVAVDGTSTLGACYFGGQILGTGGTISDRTGVAFYTSKFSGGVQTNVPQDTGTETWTYTITER